jgi:hypothetical protein
MCWSKPASLAAAVLGVGLLTAKVVFQDVPWITLLPLALYTVMELLQYKQYDTLDRCGDNTENTFLAKMAYIVIWLQPVFWNLMWAVEDGHPVFKYTLALSLFVFILCVDRNWLHIIHNGGTNKEEAHNHGRDCTRKGKTHLFWEFDLKTNAGLEPNWLWYIMMMFAPQLFLGDKDHFVKSMMVGLGLAWYMARGNTEEMSAFWCANSVPYFLFAEIATLLK